MSQQSYKNHIRWYPPHHFVFYPLMLGLIFFSSYKAFSDEAMRTLWVIITILFVCITWLAFMLRQHYALTLQNRLVLAELRYRYLATTGKRLEPLEENLTEGQLFALRFAPDDELEALTQRAIAENLTPDAIKRSIQNWRADLRRV
ncbi:DUF6526 family protein [Flavobacterium sp. J372]|uniref:DUF6526 family protein n=1 Tax=Flavobacterium sp. J372 TaxID=2898436 RepID=UPI00215127B3|nr:DUF6526 family protein [Flavobacterium sp. J372]MCR5863118.1 DUF6526 family protein [Flavobacterium sp. J372]